MTELDFGGVKTNHTYYIAEEMGGFALTNYWKRRKRQKFFPSSSHIISITSGAGAARAHALPSKRARIDIDDKVLRIL